MCVCVCVRVYISFIFFFNASLRQYWKSFAEARGTGLKFSLDGAQQTTNLQGYDP